MHGCMGQTDSREPAARWGAPVAAGALPCKPGPVEVQHLHPGRAELLQAEALAWLLVEVLHLHPGRAEWLQAEARCLCPVELQPLLPDRGFALAAARAWMP